MTNFLVNYARFRIFANRMREMQFSVVFMTILMCSALTLLMPGRVGRDAVINNETVADHCGFSRTHFQKIFNQETGVSPTEYLA